MKVSIITPSLNSEKYIEDNLKSVHLQQKGDFSIEQIIVDGNSIDSTIDIVKSFQKKHNADIKIIQGNDKNMYDAINKGIQLIQGDIWACLNTDDTYCPQIIEKVINEFAKDSNIDVVYGYINMVDEYGNLLYKLYLPKFDLEYMILRGFCSIIVQPAVFLRKRVIDKVGNFNIKYNYSSDYDFFIRVGDNCNMKLLKRSFTNFRQHSNSISWSTNTRKLHIMEAKDVSQTYLTKYNVQKKSIVFKNVIFYIKQFKPTNYRYISNEFIRNTKKRSWKQYLKHRLMK